MRRHRGVRLLAFLAPLACAAACRPDFAPAAVDTPAAVEAPVDSAAGDVPLELAGPGDAALLVPVHVNGEGPFRFVLDTGATLTCLDQSIAAQLNLPEASGVVGVGAGVGGAGQMALVTVDSMRIGNARATELMACSIDLEHTSDVGLEIDGLVGLNFLRSFRVVLDFERNVLNLQAPGAAR